MSNRPRSSLFGATLLVIVHMVWVGTSEVSKMVINFAGVAFVSEFSPSLFGSFLALLATVCNALYLTNVSSYKAKHGHVDMNLTMGTVGVLTLVVTIPLMVVGHFTGLERQLPPPTLFEFGLVSLMCFVGSVLMDYLWLYATVITSSFISSLSVTLSIPLSMLADAFFRSEPPHYATVIASRR
ncbi:Drug/metabolite transporter [Aphelenchoides avenae]|nr:Drug/metabolite transporter [Aphelenchus avenae]